MTSIEKTEERVTLSNNDDESGDRPDSETPGMNQKVQVPGVTARVPTSLGNGVMSTGAIVMNGPHTFVLDFIQQMGAPTHLVRRVVLPHKVMPKLIQALTQNLSNYEGQFGPPMKLPKPSPSGKRPSVQELYDQMKIDENEFAGHFAEGVMIRHSAADFCFDFVTQFFPNAAVSSRIFMSAPHVPPLLEALKVNYDKFKNPNPGTDD